MEKLLEDFVSALDVYTDVRVKLGALDDDRMTDAMGWGKSHKLVKAEKAVEENKKVLMDSLAALINFNLTPA